MMRFLEQPGAMPHLSTVGIIANIIVKVLSAEFHLIVQRSESPAVPVKYTRKKDLQNDHRFLTIFQSNRSQNLCQVMAGSKVLFINVAKETV